VLEPLPNFRGALVLFDENGQSQEIEGPFERLLDWVAPTLPVLTLNIRTQRLLILSGGKTLGNY
jgi:hypothetical protein